MTSWSIAQTCCPAALRVLKVSQPTSASFSCASKNLSRFSQVSTNHFTMAHFIQIFFVKHPFPSKATEHLDYQTCNQRLYFHSNQTCFTRSANSLRMTLLCALATANPMDSMQGKHPRRWSHHPSDLDPGPLDGELVFLPSGHSRRRHSSVNRRFESLPLHRRP